MYTVLNYIWPFEGDPELAPGGNELDTPGLDQHAYRRQGRRYEVEKKLSEKFHRKSSVSGGHETPREPGAALAHPD